VKENNMENKIKQIEESVKIIDNEMFKIISNLPQLDYLEFSRHNNRKSVSCGGNGSTTHFSELNAHSVLFHWWHNVLNNPLVRNYEKDNGNWCHCEVCKYHER